MTKENREKFDLAVSCSVGLENLLCQELKTLGAGTVRSVTGVVFARGNLGTAYRLCLWSRYASRVFLQLAFFPAVKDESDLYRKAFSVAWEKHLRRERTFAVSASIRGKTRIQNSQFAALRVKDALVDSLRKRTGERPSVRTQRPDVQFHLHLEEGKDGDTAGLYLDLSGEGLHRRGYRIASTIAPLKENLAAAIVSLSGWQPDLTLIDPMCGSGTLLIEAAMMAGDVAPGSSRSYFGFFGWEGHDAELWTLLVDEAAKRREAGLHSKRPLFLGYDSDPVAVRAARKNIARAGLNGVIQVRQADLATLASPCERGVLVSNLPFGERLAEKQNVAMLYRAVGRIGSTVFPHWNLAVLLADPELTDSFSLHWERKEKLFNGGIPCRLLCTSLENQQRKSFCWELPEHFAVPERARDLANRLRKNFQTMQKWAKNEKISCYRLYDRDLPEYNFSLDLYEKWLHVQEYAPPKTIPPERAEERMRGALQVIQIVLGVRSNRLFVKRRERQRGKKQYEKKNSTGKMIEVREGKAVFLVNFTDYLDTGLFLDHRSLRKRIFHEARGKRFLNLFAYTGTATVQAALGGAAETTTVDLSENYLDWAGKNLAVNGFSASRHSLVRADSMEWLREARGVFDIIFIDPPTFSNTKKEKRVFDIQRNHLELIHLAMKRLDREGVLFFSTNFRQFTLEDSLRHQYAVRDITASTIPYDFRRNRRIHQCWEVRWEIPASER